MDWKEVALECFNPTLVRLRPFLQQRHQIRRHAFQSHAGSIEARLYSFPPKIANLFQSHAGSIEARFTSSVSTIL